MVLLAAVAIRGLRAPPARMQIEPTIVVGLDGVLVDSEPATTRCAWLTAQCLWPEIMDSVTEVSARQAGVRKAWVGYDWSALTGVEETTGMPSWLAAKLRQLRPVVRDGGYDPVSIWPASAAQPADRPRLAEAWGSLGHGLALREASEEPAEQGWSTSSATQVRGSPAGAALRRGGARLQQGRPRRAALERWRDRARLAGGAARSPDGAPRPLTTCTCGRKGGCSPMPWRRRPCAATLCPCAATLCPCAVTLCPCAATLCPCAAVEAATPRGGGCCNPVCARRGMA